MSDSARRPWSARWSRMMVPVSLMATAHPVSTASARSSSAWDSGGSSRSTSMPTVSHGAGMPAGTMTRRAFPRALAIAPGNSAAETCV